MLWTLLALRQLGDEGRGLVDDAFVIGAGAFDDTCWRQAALVVAGVRVRVRVRVRWRASMATRRSLRPQAMSAPCRMPLHCHRLAREMPCALESLLFPRPLLALPACFGTSRCSTAPLQCCSTVATPVHPVGPRPRTLLALVLARPYSASTWHWFSKVDAYDGAGRFVNAYCESGAKGNSASVCALPSAQSGSCGRAVPVDLVGKAHITPLGRCPIK